MPEGPVALTGLVLAGGQSTRMGRDKATLEVDGERLVDRAVAVLRSVCATVLVAAGERSLEVVDAQVIADAEGAGPLAGIVGGLRRATTPLVAVLGVDMPDASAAVFRDLAAEWAGEAGVAPVVDGVIQPLHAVYATAFAEEFGGLLSGGEQSPRRALSTLGARLIDMSARPGRPFASSLNSPADLAQWAAPTEPS